MVACNFDRHEEAIVSRDTTYLQCLEVFVEAYQKLTSVLVLADLDKPIGSLDTRELDLRKVELRYSSLFDFDNAGDIFREYRYVVAIVTASSDPQVTIGDSILLEADIVQLIYTSDC